MLNITAKEFVPAASPRGAAIITAAAGAPTATPKTNVFSPVEDAAACTASEIGCLDGGSGGGAKAQLSPKAPAFVPRAAAGGGCLDAASDPPRSVLDPPRSDSTLSSSIVSREADGCWEAGAEGEANGEVEQQPEPCAAVSSAQVEAAAGGYYDSRGTEGYGESGYGRAPAAQGGELVPSNVYDAYNYGAYDGYVMPYRDACADSLGSTVYYDSGYDGAAASYESSYPQAAYYWGASAGAYVYGDGQYSGQYNGWQQYGGGANAAGWGPAGGSAAAGAAADSELHLEAGLSGGGLGAGADGVPMSGSAAVVGEEQLRSLAPGDAAELLEMFFPHYAGAALSRLLERTGGDLLAAFAELAAMERQVGAERAAAASSGTGGRGAGGGGGRGAGGGRSPPAVKAGGKRSGGGAAGFKLDPESFPSLPPAASPQPAKPAPSSPPTLATPAVDAAPATPAAEADDHPATATATITINETPAAPAAPSPAKPNFAALLRSSTSASAASPSAAPPPAAPSASEPSDPTKRQSLPQRGGGGVGGGGGGAEVSRGVSSSGRGGGGGAGRPVRGAASSAAAVPWVSTGEAVAAQYAEERCEAGMLARARNQYFQQATLAFLSGDKALAKQLGRKGREMNEAMKVSHAAAARRIFAQRNSAHQQQQLHGNNNNSHNQSRRQSTRQQQQQAGAHPSTAPPAPDRAKMPPQGGEGPRQQQQQQGGGESLFVDLHGLHAAEAVTLLEAQIEEARAAGCRFLRVCTGTGHHTKGAKTPARLPTAVADTLLANHLTFKTLKPGLLEAQL